MTKEIIDVPNTQNILKHIEQQKDFFKKNSNTNNSLMVYFNEVFHNYTTEEAKLYNEALKEIAIYDNDDNNEIYIIIDYIVSEFKLIFDNTSNEYIKEYIKAYLYECLDTEIHHMKPIKYCSSTISFIWDK